MELRHLRYFLAAAEEANFHRAATRLNVAAPALSRRIRDLERELGIDLFERSNKRVRLSAAGVAYLEDVRQILELIKSAGERSRRVAHGDLGVLTIGFSETALQQSVIRQTFHEFRLQHPRVELKLDPMMPAQLKTALVNGDIDAAITYDISLSVDSPQFDHVEVGRDDYVLALPKSHHLVDRTKLFLRDLNEEAFVWLRRDVSPNLHDKLLAMAQAGGLTPRIIQYAVSPSTRLHLVSVGMGLAFVMASFSNPSPESVVIRRVDDLCFSTGLELIWRRSSPSTTLKRFVEIARKLGHATSSSGPAEKKGFQKPRGSNRPTVSPAPRKAPAPRRSLS